MPLPSVQTVKGSQYPLTECCCFCYLSCYRKDIYSQTIWCNFYANLFIVVTLQKCYNIINQFHIVLFQSVSALFPFPIWRSLCGIYVCLGKMVESCSVRLHHHRSFSITSIHATATLHQSLAELPHPLHLSGLHCCCCFFSPHRQSPSLYPSPAANVLTLSQLTKWKQAAHLCLYRAKHAYNQSKRQVAKAEERWEFALSVKSLWDNAAVSLQKHKCEYNGETNLSQLCIYFPSE